MPKNTKSTLRNELGKLQEELESLQNRTSNRRQYDFFDMDRFVNSKILLIGGCILLGVGIAYLFLNKPNKCR